MLKARLITFIDVQKNQLLKLTCNRSPRMSTFSFFPSGPCLFSAACTHSGLLQCLDHNADVCYFEGKTKLLSVCMLNNSMASTD